MLKYNELGIRAAGPVCSTDVVPSQVPSNNYCVRWSVFSLVISMIIFFNLFAMPLKAYITEDLPWSPFPDIPKFANFSQFNSTTLALYQRNYNRNTLPVNTTYFEDSDLKVQVTRLILEIQGSIPQDTCKTSLLIGLPGVMFYAPVMVDILCSFTASNKSLTTLNEWDGRGTCLEQFYCGVIQAAQCFWLTTSDYVSNTKNNSNFITLTTAVGRYPTAFWNYLKFIYRLCYTILVLYILWVNYYKHCLQLKKTLEKFGHRLDMRDQKWKYVIMIGDPTPIVLTHPLVAFAFVMDILTSDSTNTLAVLRASQTENIVSMLSAFLYLSRAVWFSYLSISLISILLKRRKLEHLFTNIDLTLAVILSALIESGISYCAGNTLFTIELYQKAQSCFVPEHLQNERIEGVPVVAVYVAAGFLWPLCYGFLVPYVRHRHTHRITPLSRQDTIYSSVWFNPLKTRALHHLERFFFTHSATKEFGGTIYKLFALHPRYQQYPAISFCSVDCFICCYHNNVLQSRIRLSLLDTLDRNQTDPFHTITDSTTPSSYTFNSIQTNEPRGNFFIARSKIPSAWCF